MNLEELKVMRIYKFLIVLQIFAIAHTSHVQNAKARIRSEVEEALDDSELSLDLRNDGSSRTLHVIAKARHPNRWRTRHRSHHGPIYTPWTAWSKCDTACKRSRERYCKVKRKCGYTKHIEEKLCPQSTCQQKHYTSIFQHQLQLQPLVTPGPIATAIPLLVHSNYAMTTTQKPPSKQNHYHDSKGYQHHHQHHHHKRHKLKVYEEFHNSPKESFENIDENDQSDEFDDNHYNHDKDGDFFVVKMNHKKRYRKKRKPILIEVEDYDELEHEDDDNSLEIDGKNGAQDSYILNKKLIKAIRYKNNNKWRRNDNFNDNFNDHKKLNQQQQNRKKNLQNSDWDGGGGGVNGDSSNDYEYVNFNYNQNNDNDYNYDDYDDNFDLQNTTKIPPRQRAVYEMPRHRRAYAKWSDWTKCSAKCTTRRYKKCRLRDVCNKEVLREIAYCYTEGSFCQQWLQSQIKKPTDSKPMPSRRKDVALNQNAIANDFILNGKGYRGTEYQPMKLQCGISAIRNNKRNMYNLLKIIGGKQSRKGEWPWQVVIFNRFKEAFCGGTLIAPNWIVTAAHCVRKVLYVRLGEHNLDYEDGTEIEYRVVRSIKHPSYDKKTVDSDIALLRLPKAINSTHWIGYSCLPKPYQKLPKNIQCTVIGWGKRRNRDSAGTSVLHQAEVPIIQMDNCKTVYNDYTITNNMFCAGHKRGRIDTCAGDSGGPLLCRDSTKPNHPWTVFGITSFGDGCAKRNKFGIYTKVPNYVDWIWSVVNCNGNCKTNSLRRKL